MRTSATHPLHVDLLPRAIVNLDGRLGICEAPGRYDPQCAELVERDLDCDLARLHEHHAVDVLVTLLERGQFVRDELSALRLTGLLAAVRSCGITSIWHELPAGDVPVAIDPLLGLVDRLLGLLRAGERVVLHCRDGLGRSTLVAACCLTALGASVDEAVDEVRAMRPGALERTSHRQALAAFDQRFRRRAIERSDPEAAAPVLAWSEEPSGSGADGQRLSGSGLAPLSQPGAATLLYRGLTDGAARAGVARCGPLRQDDLLHILPGRALTIGRGGGCDAVIRSTQLSRVHALVAFTPALGGCLLVADMRSRNGTWMGEEQHQVLRLAVGEQFELAKAYQFRFEGIG